MEMNEIRIFGSKISLKRIQNMKDMTVQCS